MEFNVRDMASDLTSRAGGAFSGLRDRFGGGNNRRQDNYDDGYDDYGYDEYGYDDNAYDDVYGAYDNPYDEYAYDPEEDAPRSSAYGRAGSSGGVKYPSLVTAEDIRTSTQATERIRRENAAAGIDEPVNRYAAPRTNVAYVNPAYDPAMNGGASVAGMSSEGGTRSRGYDSLFTSTTSSSAPATPTSTYAAERPAPMTDDDRISTRPVAGAYDPYAAYQGAGAASHTPNRNLKVIAPTSYGDVESVSRALKAGDVVVLQLTRTASDLSKRILDFSFGVASALDARVDVVADKVFVIARGNGLTVAEKQTLSERGVL